MIDNRNLTKAWKHKAEKFAATCWTNSALSGGKLAQACCVFFSFAIAAVSHVSLKVITARLGQLSCQSTRDLRDRRRALFQLSITQEARAGLTRLSCIYRAYHLQLRAA